MKVYKKIMHVKAKVIVLFVATLSFSPVIKALPVNYNGHGCMISCTKTGKIRNTKWILDKTVSNVDFYHAITICDGSKTVFLKFNNRNKYPVKITWEEVYKTTAEEKKDGFGGRKELLLHPGVSMPDGCLDAASKKSILLSSQVNPALVAEIVDFSFKEITVNTYKTAIH